jgi:hypothetical protein
MDAFGTKVIVSEVLVICMDANFSTFEKRTVFLESLDTREKFFVSLVE